MLVPDIKHLLESKESCFKAFNSGTVGIVGVMSFWIQAAKNGPVMTSNVRSSRDTPELPFFFRKPGGEVVLRKALNEGVVWEISKLNQVCTVDLHEGSYLRKSFSPYFDIFSLLTSSLTRDRENICTSRIPRILCWVNAHESGFGRS